MNTNRCEVFLSEDGKWLTVNGPLIGVSHTFELVDSVLPGYFIWNIGENMADGYLPLCRLSAYQPFPGGRSIEQDTLKAIRCEGAQIILSAIHSGAGTVAKMEQYIRRKQDAKVGTWEHEMVENIKKALPYMRQIKGLEK